MNNEERLARKVVRLQEALDITNKHLKKAGMLGVIPSDIHPSFRESRRFYSKVKKVKNGE